MFKTQERDGCYQLLVGTGSQQGQTALKVSPLRGFNLVF